MRRRMAAIPLAALLALAALPQAALPAKALAFVLDTTDNRANEAQAVAAQLKQVGIDTQVRVWKGAALLDQVRAGQRSAYTTDWGSAYFDPFDLAEPKLTTGGRGNFSFYTNPAVDRDLRRASTTTNEAIRKAAYFDVQQAVYADAPWVFGYVLQNIEAAATAVEGWTPAADNGETMYAVGVRGGDALVVGMRTDTIGTFDPAIPPNPDTESVLRNIYDALVAHTWQAARREE